MNKLIVTKLRKIIREEIIKSVKRKRLNEAEHKSDPDYTTVHKLLTAQLNKNHSFPLEVDVSGVSRGHHDFSDTEIVNSASELSDLILSIGVDYHGSIEEFREYQDDYVGNADTFKTWVSNMEYESTDTWVIASIDEDTSIILPIDDEDDEDDDY